MDVSDFPGGGVELEAFDALAFDGISVGVGTGHGKGKFDGIAVKEAVVLNSPEGAGESSEEILHHGLDFGQTPARAELGGVIGRIGLEAGPDILKASPVREQDVMFRELDGILHDG